MNQFFNMRQSAVTTSFWVCWVTMNGASAGTWQMDDFGNLVPLSIPAFARFVGNNA